MVDLNRSKLAGVQLPRAGMLSHIDKNGEPMIPAEALRRPARPSHAETLGRQLRRVERQERYAKVKVMHEGGESIRSIARQLGMSRGTVYHYLRIDGNPTESQWPVKPSMLDPYISYLHRRWQDGCENAAQFVRELREHGYTGSRKMVAVWVAQRRRIPAKTGPRKYREHSNHNQEPEASASTEGKGAKREQGGGGGGGGKHKGKGERTPSSVQFSYFLMREPESLSMVEQAVLSQLQQVSRKMSKSGIIRCALQMRGSFTTYRAECRCE